MTAIETRIANAKKALRQATTEDKVLALANKCCQLMKDGNQQQVDEVSTAIYTALRRFK